MSAESEGDKSSTVDEPDTESSSIDVLLAELLGPQAKAPETPADEPAHVTESSVTESSASESSATESTVPDSGAIDDPDAIEDSDTVQDAGATGGSGDEERSTSDISDLLGILETDGAEAAATTIDDETAETTKVVIGALSASEVASVGEGKSGDGESTGSGEPNPDQSPADSEEADSPLSPAPTGHPPPTPDASPSHTLPTETSTARVTAADTLPDEPASDPDDEPGRDAATQGGLTPLAEPSPVRTRSRTFAVLKLAVVAALGLYVLLVIAWGIDLARHQSTVVRGVESEGTSLAGMSRGDLRDLIEDRQAQLAQESVDVRVGDTTVTSDPVTLGMSIDGEQLIDDAFEIGRIGFFPLRPITWFTDLFGSTPVETAYLIDAKITTDAARSIVASKLQQAKEPEMILDGNEQLMVIPGETGTTISERELVGRLPATIAAGPPFEIELQAVAAEPELDQTAVESIADEINELTAEAVRIQVLDDTATIEPAVLKSWAMLDKTEELTWLIDQDRALADLKPLFPELGSEDQQARFTVIGDNPVIVPASETVICCDENSVGMIQDGLSAPLPTPPSDEESEEAADEDEEAVLRTIVLEPTIVGFDEGVAELESLGILEEVSTFTTNHSCCQNRVKNIQRFADLMQGVVIRPGETLSLNGHVGQRTREKGFVADGAINLGVLEPQVGGGISQYATTFFNASFFAGLEFVEYQSHSLYISRYPRGREATISWKKPDLKVRNNTPYGILVWNEYTPTSITVSFYSTEHLEIEALPLRRSSERQCRVDITPRLTKYPDGTEVEDTVYAVYRPGEGLDCNGNSTRPEQDQPAPASPVVQEPEPPPTEPAEPAEPVEPNPDPGGED